MRVVPFLFHMVINLVYLLSHFAAFFIEVVTTQKLLRLIKLRVLNDCS